MKEQGNGKFEVKLVKTLSPEQKKLFIVAPAVVGVAIMVLYFSLFAEEKNPQDANTNSIDLELPNAQTKELSNEKEVVFNDFDEYRKERSKADNFDDVLGDPLGDKKEEQEPLTEDDQLMTVKKQLQELENKKKTASAKVNSNNYNQNYNNSKPVRKAVDEDLEEEESDPIVVYVADNHEKQNREELKSNSNNTYAAKIAGSQTVTKSSPMVSIVILEDLPIGNVVLKKYTYISAMATFDESRVYLNISSVSIDNKVYDTNINVLDTNGYEGIPVKGGTGAKAQEEVADDSVNEVINGTPLNQVPGARGLRRIFDKKAKAKLNSDKIRLKIEG